MPHAYVINNVSKNWYMQIEPTTFICIKFQMFYWIRCNLPNTLNLEDYGLVVCDNSVSPCWFVGVQFPPCPPENEQSVVNGSPAAKRRRSDEEKADGDGDEDDFFYDDVNNDLEDDEMNFIYFDSDSEGSTNSCSDYED